MRCRNTARAAAAFLCAALLLSAGCAPAASAPAETGTFEPALLETPTALPESEAPSVAYISAPLQTLDTGMDNTRKAKIVSFSADIRPEIYNDFVNRLNKALAAAGQNVWFEVQYTPYMSGVSDPFMEKVQAELAAGNPSADAFTLNIWQSRILSKDKLTMDLTDLVPEYAPIFTSRYNSLFSEQLTGVPIGIAGRSLSNMTCLLLRKDFDQAWGSASTTDSLFRFLDEVIVKQKMPYAVRSTSNKSILNQWALENGYYDLANYGLEGYLYAAVDDPSCTPIPLEDLPGVDDFIVTLNRYQDNRPGRKRSGLLQTLSDHLVEWIEGRIHSASLPPRTAR